MKKKLIFLAIVALLTFCLGIAACGGKSISITFHGVSDTTVQAEAGKEIELPSDPVKAGYTFGGWFADEDLTVAFDAEAGVSEDTEVWAKFTANTDTEYTVVHLQQDLTGDTFTEKERETLTGTTDTQTAAAAKDYEGFTAQTVTQTNIEGDGSAVVEIRYLRNTFTVTLKKDNGEADAVLTDVRYGTSASILYAQENVPAKRGYDFEGWYDGDQRVGEDDALEGAVSLTAKYTAGTAAYTAEYYLEGLDGAFVRDDSLTADGSGTTDSTVTAEPKQIEHFTFDEDNAGNVLQGTVAADGSLVLRLYYTRNSYTVTFKNGDEVLSTQSVKYEVMPVYEGETPEKEVQGMICLFAGFGEAAPVTADAEYAAQFVEVKDYNGYRFTESFTLPDLTETMQGREYKQYLDNAEITAGTQTASVGGHTWKIALIEEDEILSEAEIAIEVVTEEEYYADYGLGDTDQFLNRFLVDAGAGMSFTYEILDAETYGAASAYRYKSAGRSTWDQRLELRLSTTETDISQYDTVEFDIWVNSGSATFPLLIIDPDKYIGYTVMEKDTQTVVDKTAVQAGKWYHMTAAVPDGAKSLAATNICLADAGEIVDLYIRNVQLCKAEAPFLTSVGCKAVITKDAEGIAGRTDVYKYVSTDTAWNSRAQFTKETYAKYNALYENGGGKMTMDICFTGTVNAIQFWGIQGGAMPDFTSSSSPKAVWKDAEGNVVAPEKIVANTWYTLELDVNAIGKLDISNNDRGLQFATLSDNGGVFYIDNLQYKDVTVIFHGATDIEVAVVSGSAVPVPADPVKAGYTFGGWFADEDLTVAFDAEAGVSEDTEVWAKFTANTDTEYTVVHLQQDLTGDTFTEKERETLTGTTDTQTAAAAKEYEGFTAQAVTQTNIEGDGSAVVEIRYLRNTFTVTLKKDNGEADAVLTDVRYGTSASVLYAQENVPVKRGYDFEGWYDGDQRVAEDAVLTQAKTFTAHYNVKTGIPYDIEYYLEGVNGEFVKDESRTEYGSGTTDSTVTAEAKQIEHFTFDEDNAGNVLQGTVAADGSLVLRLYYTRNSYTVTFKNGDEVLSTQSVKYEVMPVYEGETPEKEVQGMICLFAGFGEAAPVTADAEYAAQFVEVKDYNGYRFTESFTLPDLTEAMQGREYKQYLDNAEITAGTQTASVGGHTWKIALVEEDEILSEAEIAIEVVTEEEYYADYGLGDTDQFLNRFLVDAGVGMSFAYEVLDAETYGAASAYRYKSAGRSTWDQRLELRLSTTETDISQYDTVEFDIWVNSGSATFPFLIIDPDKYIVYTVMEKDTQTIVDKTAVQAGKWYHMTAAVPDGAKSLAATNICLADAGEIVDLYIRNVQLCKAEAPFLTSVGCKAVITKDAEGIAGRTDVYKYVSTDTAWNSRAQFTKETYAKYNALYENGGGKMTMDICFTGTVNAIQFWGIQGGAMPDFTSSSSPKAVWKDAEGNVVAPEKIVANTWYTLELDVNAIGKLDISNNDRGLQLATLSDNGGVFYIDNVQFIPAA